MGFSRQEYWSGLPFPPPENLPHPGTELTSTCISCSGKQIHYYWATREAQTSSTSKTLVLSRVCHLGSIQPVMPALGATCIPLTHCITSWNQHSGRSGLFQDVGCEDRERTLSFYSIFCSLICFLNENVYLVQLRIRNTSTGLSVLYSKPSLPFSTSSVPALVQAFSSSLLNVCCKCSLSFPATSSVPWFIL